MNGKAWALSWDGKPRLEREADAVRLAKGAEHYAWAFVPVPCGPDSFFYAALDYFAVGTAEDFVRVPLSGPNAQAVADATGCLLPTRGMVNLIWKAAKLAGSAVAARGMGPPYTNTVMQSVSRLLEHEARVAGDFATRQAPPTSIRAGHKKDVVVSPAMATHPGWLAFFGFFEADGNPIQRLNLAAHDEDYDDYSHGVRLILPRMVVRGVSRDVLEVLASADAGLISDEGPFRPLRYPTAMSNAAPPTLRLGSKGAAVMTWQASLNLGPRPTTWVNSKGVKRSWDASWPWPLKVDGDFGTKSVAATEAFQAAHGLVADGVVGQASWGTAVSPTSATIPPPDPNGGKFYPGCASHVPAKYQKLVRPVKPRMIVAHTAETPETAGAAEGVAGYFKNPQRKDAAGKLVAVIASAGYVVDSDSVVVCVADDAVAWHTEGKLGGEYVNDFAIGVEHAGTAAQTAAQWTDPYSTAMLERSAQLLAWLCTTYDIEPVYLTVEDLKAGKTNGITGHVDCNKASGKGTHWDPGPNWPWTWLIARVRAIMGLA